MAKLIVGLNECKRKVAYCEACRQQVYAPSNFVVYEHCYNCGAKFDRPYSARDIKELIRKEMNKNE